MTIRITRPLATHLLTLAQQSSTQPICGLVGAQHAHPRTVYPLNTAQSDDIQTTVTSLQQQNETLFAVYYSHPQQAAIPSVQDITQLQLDNLSNPYYLVISLNIKGVLEMRAWQRVGQEFDEVELTV
ncbi:MAG: Mov34/MPN/PAD-1 family protein [Gammaproteobacteria bacterium]|nr:Mov34/MPN/PAD-1 family protein [Gammaproteobacteria bacterium]